MKGWIRVVAGVWSDGRLLVHEMPREDAIIHGTGRPANCWCEPEVVVRKHDRMVRHQNLMKRGAAKMANGERR